MQGRLQRARGSRGRWWSARCPRGCSRPRWAPSSRREQGVQQRHRQGHRPRQPGGAGREQPAARHHHGRGRGRGEEHRGPGAGEAADLGLIGSTLTGRLHGRPAVVSPSRLPQPTRVDSRGRSVASPRTTSPSPGRRSAPAARRSGPRPIPVPGRSRIVETITGLLDVQAGRAEATTRVIKGEAREAHAQVSVDVGIGGSSSCPACDGTPSTGPARTRRPRRTSTSARPPCWACRSDRLLTQLEVVLNSISPSRSPSRSRRSSWLHRARRPHPDHPTADLSSRTPPLGAAEPSARCST